VVALAQGFSLQYSVAQADAMEKIFAFPWKTRVPKNIEHKTLYS
jgi:hypothetical protein